MRIGVGVLLIFYSTYSLARPALKPMHAGVQPMSASVSSTALLGGLTGLVGIVVTIWCQLRGWPKDDQRAIFQPVLLVTCR